MNKIKIILFSLLFIAGVLNQTRLFAQSTEQIIYDALNKDSHIINSVISSDERIHDLIAYHPDFSYESFQFYTKEARNIPFVIESPVNIEDDIGLNFWFKPNQYSYSKVSSASKTVRVLKNQLDQKYRMQLYLGELREGQVVDPKENKKEFQRPVIIYLDGKRLINGKEEYFNLNTSATLKTIERSRELMPKSFYTTWNNIFLSIKTNSLSLYFNGIKVIEEEFEFESRKEFLKRMNFKKSDGEEFFEKIESQSSKIVLGDLEYNKKPFVFDLVETTSGDLSDNQIFENFINPRKYNLREDKIRGLKQFIEEFNSPTISDFKKLELISHYPEFLELILQELLKTYNISYVMSTHPSAPRPKNLPSYNLEKSFRNNDIHPDILLKALNSLNDFRNKYLSSLESYSKVKLDRNQVNFLISFHRSSSARKFLFEKTELVKQRELLRVIIGNMVFLEIDNFRSKVDQDSYIQEIKKEFSDIIPEKFQIEDFIELASVPSFPEYKYEDLTITYFSSSSRFLNTYSLNEENDTLFFKVSDERKIPLKFELKKIRFNTRESNGPIGSVENIVLGYFINENISSDGNSKNFIRTYGQNRDYGRLEDRFPSSEHLYNSNRVWIKRVNHGMYNRIPMKALTIDDYILEYGVGTSNRVRPKGFIPEYYSIDDSYNVYTRETGVENLFEIRNRLNFAKKLGRQGIQQKDVRKIYMSNYILDSVLDLSIPRFSEYGGDYSDPFHEKKIYNLMYTNRRGIMDIMESDRLLKLKLEEEAEKKRQEQEEKELNRRLEKLTVFLSAWAELEANSGNNESTNDRIPQKRYDGEDACYNCKGSGLCDQCGKEQRVTRYVVERGKIPGHTKSHYEIRPGMKVCSYCHGAGGHAKSRHDSFEKYIETCYLCGGEGWRKCNKCNVSSNGRNIGKCRICKGTGKD